MAGNSCRHELIHKQYKRLRYYFIISASVSDSMSGRMVNLPLRVLLKDLTNQEPTFFRQDHLEKRKWCIVRFKVSGSPLVSRGQTAFFRFSLWWRKKKPF